MSVSIDIYGIVPADEKYKKMLEIYNLCKETNVSIPNEVDEFFKGELPEQSGIQFSLTKIIKEYKTKDHDVYDIEVDEIPKNVKTLRVRFG